MLRGVEARRSLQLLHIHIISPGKQAETNWKWPRVSDVSIRLTRPTCQGRNLLYSSNWLPRQRKIIDPRYTIRSRMLYPSQRISRLQRLQHLCKFLPGPSTELMRLSPAKFAGRSPISRVNAPLVAQITSRHQSCRERALT